MLILNTLHETAKRVGTTEVYHGAHPDPVAVNAEDREAEENEKDGARERQFPTGSEPNAGSQHKQT